MANGTEGSASESDRASRILCKRHNEALSGLDSCALRCFRYLMDAPAHLREPSEKRDQLYMFSGPDLERWTIKALTRKVYVGSFASEREAKAAERRHVVTQEPQAMDLRRTLSEAAKE